MSTLDDVLRDLDNVVSATLAEAGKLGVETAQGTSLFKTSQNFRDMIVTYPESQTSQVVWSTASWSHYLEYGNNQLGDRIYPTTAKFLHFFVDGEEVFAKSVRSHGPLPFMAEAEDKVQQEGSRIWEQELAKKF